MPTLGFFGCAHIHTPGFIKAIQKRPAIKVKAVFDMDVARAELRAKELGAKVVRDFSEINNDQSIDAVVICSETNRHRDFVIEAAKAKKTIFVEKPLGMYAEDAHQMADAVEKAGVKFQTG